MIWLYLYLAAGAWLTIDYLARVKVRSKSVVTNIVSGVIACSLCVTCWPLVLFMRVANKEGE